jgi:TPP-dependent 2-oxoacid decarboxylase
MLSILFSDGGSVFASPRARAAAASIVPFEARLLTKTITPWPKPLAAPQFAAQFRFVGTSFHLAPVTPATVSEPRMFAIAPHVSRVSCSVTPCCPQTYSPTFPLVTLTDFLKSLRDAVAKHPAQRAAPALPAAHPRPASRNDATITFERFFEVVGEFVLGKEVRDQYILILGESTSLYVFGNLFGLPAKSFVAQAAWGSLGHETGSALGVALATGKRPLVVAGDGGFMMICQEISSLVQKRVNAAVFVMSNRVYAIEQAFVDLKAFQPSGKFAPFNKLSKWDYGALARAFGARGVTVKCVGDLRRLLRKLPRLAGPTLVEVVVPTKDLAPQLARLAEVPAPMTKYRREHRASLPVV